jgi:eukaryotic-like serine/threonine-protein kinase
MVGQTISHYRVLRKLGGGGMGDVYEAQDLNLGRHVALKVLPPARSRDPHALLRFEREARAASALNHPHICTIHDIGEHGGQRFTVMELLEGQSVRDRLRKGRIELAQLLDLGVQIADALDAAHRAGIIHRDVTPANIFITKRGDAKVLDFGLAKLAPASRTAPAGGTDGAASSAETHPDSLLTSPGAAVGTVAYMSPEQACGDELDHRSDLFSFGAVLYEMATGQRPFRGKTSALIFDGILNEAPVPVTQLKPELPAELQHIVEKALEKDRDLRYQSASEFKSDLERLRRTSGSHPGAVAPGAQGVRAARLRSGSAAAAAERLHAATVARALPWLLGGLSRKRAIVLLPVVVAAVAAVLSLRGREPPMPTFASRQLTFAAGWEAEPAISRQGDVVAYASNEASASDIFQIDTLRSSQPIRLTTEEGPKHDPTWVGDGSRVVFTWERKPGRLGIYWVPRGGGRPPTLLLEDAEHPAISPDGRRIAFARKDHSGDRRIFVAGFSATGIGEPTRLTTGQGDGLWDHRDPAWSPDGKTICYSAHHGLWTIAVADGRARLITQETTRDTDPVWSSDGRFVYFTSARDGLTALWRVPAGGGIQRRLTTSIAPERHASLSADGRRLVFSNVAPNPDIVVRDLETGNESAVVTDARNGNCPVWGPDGAIYFVSDRGGRPDLWVQPPPPLVGDPKADWQLTDQPAEVSHPAVSPDGRWMAYYRVDEQDSRDIWIVSSAGGVPARYAGHPAKDYHPAWSPDGTKLAFASDRTGGLHIWVAGVSEGRLVGEPKQITFGSSADQDQAPCWSPEGTRVAYIAQIGGGTYEVRIADAEGQGDPVRVGNTQGAHRVRWDRQSGLLFMSGTFDRPLVTLRRVDPNDFRVVPLNPAIEFGANTDLIDFDISRDGRRLLFSKETNESRRGDICALEAQRRPF